MCYYMHTPRDSLSPVGIFFTFTTTTNKSSFHEGLIRSEPRSARTCYYLMITNYDLFSLNGSLGQFSHISTMSVVINEFVPSVNNQNRESWRLLVEEHNIEVYQTTPKSVRSHFLSPKSSLGCV